MDIKDILDSLGLDLSNPEAKRGAIEAIDAILASRAPLGSLSGSAGGMGGGQEQEVELDPDLLMPSVKQMPSGDNNDDIEVEDEEHILDQIKHNDSEEPIQNTNSAGKDSDSDSSESSDSIDDSESSDIEEPSGDSSKSDDDTTDSDEADSKASGEYSDENEGAIESESGDEIKNSTEDDEAAEENSSSKSSEEDNIDGEVTEEESASEDEIDSDEFNYDADDEDSDAAAAEDDEVDSEEGGEEDDFDFDEDDLLDDEIKNSTEDDEIKTKQKARKIKRERTLAAAKKALADAQTKNVAPALIRELEKAIEALEALTEAVTKSINNISDTEFNMMINRVFDAIQACGDSGLTFTSEEEREAQVKEIKDDMASAQTQAELSAEDVAKIRAETQAAKAREKEVDKYRSRSGSSFKGFQEFLNSLYRAVALQVHVEETRDDSWSAINRRHSGTGVLQPGKKVQELPNKKIPVIDFYFDQSGSWTSADIKVGEKAVQSLAEMEENGQIKINVYYFSDNVFTDAESAREEGGTGAWNEIVKNVIATQATNVIIMTDSDMETWWHGGKALSYTVPGYVWYLWKRGSNAPRLPRDLKGRGGTQQFAFNTSDA